jgi:hypothetical protein
MALDKIDGGTPLPGAYRDKARNVDSQDGSERSEPDGTVRADERPDRTTRTTDRAEISEGARKMADLQAALDAGRAALAATPDVRSETLAKVRERLASGYYQSVEVHDKTAARVEQVVRDLEDV